MRLLKNIQTLLLNNLKHLTSFALASLLLFVISCDDPDLYELTSPKGNNLFDYNYTDTTTVKLRTIREDSIRSDEFTKDLIGAYSDAIIGKVKASVFANLRLPNTEVNWGDSPEFDSVIINIKYSDKDDFFGNINDEVTFNVYEITDSIFRDSVYYSNANIKYNSLKIGSFNGKLNPTDSTSISFALSQDFGQKIFNASKDILSDNELFSEFLKGIAIIPEYPVSNGGSIVYFLLNDDSSNITVYYNDSLNYKFQFNNYSARISKFEHDYAGTDIETQLQNPQSFYDEVYLQPLSGVKLQVDLPYLKNLIDSGMVVIHKAELIFNVSAGYTYNENLSNSLLLLGLDDENNYTAIPDRLEDHYGGYLQDEDHYSFVITRYVQQLLKLYEDDPNYFQDYTLNLIVPSDNPISANPVVIRQFNTQGNQDVKLRISFTKL